MYILMKLDSRLPDIEPADLRIPAFNVGDLIESSSRRHRHHPLLDTQKNKALIVDVYPLRGNWAYDVLLDSELWTGVSASIVEADWKLSPTGNDNELVDLSN